MEMKSIVTMMRKSEREVMTSIPPILFLSCLFFLLFLIHVLKMNEDYMEIIEEEMQQRTTGVFTASVATTNSTTAATTTGPIVDEDGFEVVSRGGRRNRGRGSRSGREMQDGK